MQKRPEYEILEEIAQNARNTASNSQFTWLLIAVIGALLLWKTW